MALVDRRQIFEKISARHLRETRGHERKEEWRRGEGAADGVEEGHGGTCGKKGDAKGEE